MSDHESRINETGAFDRTEVERNMELAREALKTMHSDDDLKTAIMDGIANLLILGFESEINIADAVYDGVAHFCATYMDQMEAENAEEWLNTTLFPFSGDNDFEFYVGAQAIVLSGHEGKISPPEFGV